MQEIAKYVYIITMSLMLIFHWFGIVLSDSFQDAKHSISGGIVCVLALCIAIKLWF